MVCAISLFRLAAGLSMCSYILDIVSCLTKLAIRLCIRLIFFEAVYLNVDRLGFMCSAGLPSQGRTS